ncbi:MAG: hypothetical protein Q9222_003288 [Ikaeria aurantiellina]
MKAASLIGGELLRSDGLQTLRHRRRSSSRLRDCRCAGNGHGTAIRQPPRASASRNEQAPRISLSLLGINRRVLMEDLVRIGVQPEEPAGDIALVGRDNGILRHVFDLVGLAIGIWDRRILIIFAGPFGTAGKGFVRGESAEEVERVSGFVDVHVNVREGVAKEDDVSAVVVGMATCGGEGDDMPDKLAGMDWEATEAVDQIAQDAIATFVEAELPG